MTIISGKLIDGFGKPLANTQMRALAAETSVPVVGATAYAMTDSQGNYSFPLEVGNYVFSIWFGELGYQYVGNIQIIQGTPDSSLDQILVLPPVVQPMVLTRVLQALIDAENAADSAAQDAINILTPLGKMYATSTQAQADIANIPDGSYVFARSSIDVSIADEYINNAGTLSKTGKQLPSAAYVKSVYSYLEGMLGNLSIPLSALTGSNTLSIADGSQTPSTNWRNSGYISVKKGQAINLTAVSNSPTYANIIFYDINKAFVSAYYTGDASNVVASGSYIVPVDGYILLATRTATSMQFSCEIVNLAASENDVNSAVTELKNYVDNVIGFTDIALSALTGSNYIDAATGSLISAVNWRNSTYLSVSPGQKISMTAVCLSSNEANIAFYDVNKMFISSDRVSSDNVLASKLFTVPANAQFIIVATRYGTDPTFVCHIVDATLTVDNKDKSGGYTSYDLFKSTTDSILSDTTKVSGETAFPLSGFVNSSSPTTYPTASSTAYNSGYVKIPAGALIKAQVAMSNVGYAIAFFSTQDPASFVEGVIGIGAEAVTEYTYRAPTDGYVVMSLTVGILPSARTNSSYSTYSNIVKRSQIDSSLDSGIPSLKNIVDNKAADVYYDDEDVKSSSGILDNYYVGVDGSLVSSGSHRLHIVELEAGESVYAKVNFNGSSLLNTRGIPILSKFISEGVFEPLSFAFQAGTVYSEHLYTATESCKIYVASYRTDSLLPATIQKRKYAIGSQVKQYKYSADTWETAVVRSNTNSGRVDPDINFMSTPLIPVKKGDIVLAKSAQNSTSAAGVSLSMGCRYDVVGKYLGSTLSFTYVANSVYGYAAALVVADGYISVNHYVSGGLSDPEVIVFSAHENELFSVKGPASNPYGDVYYGYGYDESGAMGKVAGSVTYLFDKDAVPKDATVTVSFRSGASIPLVRLDANRNVLSVDLFSAGIKTLTLLDLFNSADVQYVGITHSSDGRRDNTSVNLQVEARNGKHSFFELSDPIYNLYELAGRPDKTLAYDYTPLLQKLCIQMERQKRGKVYMESGLYKVSGCYIKSYNYIYGDGMYNTIISGADIPFKNEKLSTNIYEKVTITDLGFNLDLLGTRAGRGINMEYVKDLTCRNIWIYKSGITGFGVDMWTGTLDNIITEGCGQSQQDGSCAGMGIGVGALLEGSEHMLITNCVNRNNYGHGMFFEWHNHKESSGETVIGDFPVGINVVNCYSEGNAVGFGNAGGNGVSFVNCTAYHNLNGFAADNGSQVAAVRYGKNALFTNCVAIENGADYIENPYFTPRQMRYGNGNGFAIYKTADYADAEIGDNSRGYHFNNCISENNASHGLRIVAATNVTTPIEEVSINGGSFSRNGGSGVQFGNATENIIIRGIMALNNSQNGIGVSAQLTDAIIKDNIIKGNGKGMSAASADYMASSIVKDNIVNNNTINLENVTNS